MKIKLPETRDELWGFVYARFGVRLGYKVFTKGHSTPLDFLCDAFFNPSKDIACWSCRSGGKTLSASILAAMEFIKYSKLQSRVLSGSKDQAMFLYGYWNRWCGAVLKNLLDGDVKKTQTLISGGRLEILAASQKKVRGGKVQRLFEDEVDEMDPKIDSAAVGMLASMPDIPARTIYTSTWHRNDGLMGKLIESAEKNGISLHKWNIWEAIAKCELDRHLNGKGCESCRLADECVAKAREFYKDPQRRTGIAADACGLYSIDDVIKAYKKVSRLMWDAEFLCNRPTAEGLVYPEFDELKNRCETTPAELKIYRTIDWGRGVFVCLWIGVDRQGRIFVLDTYRSEKATLAQHAEYIKSHRLQNIYRTYCDPAGRNRSDQSGQSNIEIFNQYGIHCDYTLTPRLRKVSHGIDMVRGCIAPADGKIKLFYIPCENNNVFVKAMQSYRNRKVNGIWLDSPQDPQEFEHIPDALRYFVINLNKNDRVAVVGYRAI